VRHWFSRARQRIRWLWERARTERATPRQIGWAVFTGVFIGCTPIVGFRGYLSLGAATILRLNRLFAWIGSLVVSNFIATPFVILAEIQMAHFARTGAFVSMSTDDALEKSGALLLDWCIGSVVLALAGLASYAFALRRQQRAERERRDEATTRTLALSLEPSSESPPSGSPDPAA
jgi:uncharacterized protein (DUF2062 family)